MKNQMMVIGLDGGTFTIIDPLIEKGELPNLAFLKKNGYCAELESTKPPLTSPAWPSFMTGVNPGKHGLYGFGRFKPDYTEVPFSMNDLKRRSIFSILTSNGLRCVVINVPMTYPPEEVDGIMVSGYGAPGEDSNFTLPIEIKNELQKEKYSILGLPSNFQFSDEKAEEYFSHVYESEKKRHRLAKRLLKRVDWDFFMIVYGGTDSISHYFWKYYDKGHPMYEERYQHLGSKIGDIYGLADSFIGELRSEYPKTKIMIMSDHGFGRIERYFYPNTYFKNEGLLALGRSTAPKTARGFLRSKGFTGMNIKRILNKLHLSWLIKMLPMKLKKKIPYTVHPSLLDLDYSKTKFFSIGDMGQIFVNRKDYFERGIVEGKDVAKECLKIKEKLLSIEFEGKKIIDRVYLKEEIYSGEHLSYFPDILFETSDSSFEVLRAISEEDIFGLPIRKNGTHRKEGIFFFYDPSGNSTLNEGYKKATILDICPTILDIYGIPIRDYMDGRSLLKTEARDFKAADERSKISKILDEGRFDLKKL